MGTIERLEILNEKYMAQEEVNDIWKNAKVRIIKNEEPIKLYSKKDIEEKERTINKLLKRVSDLEFEIEKLEKNEQYKYINGQAYFRQDYVLGREKEIDRLNAELNLYKDNQEHLNNLLEQKNNIINELEKWLEECKDMCVNYTFDDTYECEYNFYQQIAIADFIKSFILNKLQELKGSDKE